MNLSSLKINQGIHIVLKTQSFIDQNEEIYAVGCADQMLFTFVANAGTINRTYDVQRKYNKNIFDELGRQESTTVT